MQKNTLFGVENARANVREMIEHRIVETNAPCTLRASQNSTAARNERENDSVFITLYRMQ
ncbi:hypothetical protein WM40_18075 [Robbsia andropogonis]|uniref:Uncharacterized protein n=1 Tax=Robbsia andropogonis TaxID=28092 RepID=A0A0F5JYJ0_9BURK|nr:hypothetical protein WM40_18075 [Robbsia andropogonis]